MNLEYLETMLVFNNGKQIVKDKKDNIARE